MEIALLLLLFALVFWVSKQLSGKLDENWHEINHLRSEVLHLRDKLEKQATRPATGIAAAPEQAQESRPKPVAPPVVSTPPPAAPTPPPAIPIPRPEPVRQPQPELESRPVPGAIPLRQPIPTAAFSEVPAEATEPSIFDKFRENLDWEKFIGENLINKLGIAILVLGIGFFVKYAIDQDWINEVGRVAIGILAGGALLAVAHRLQKTYQAFSSVLVGGGMAVLYFTIAIAFHEYQIFSQTVAFLLMVVITGFTIFLSIAYNRMELAVLALIGGFASPFMASSGEGNYIALFVFILVLNLGILVLAYFKKWSLLNTIAYVFTIVLYGGWLTTRVIDTPDAPYAGALVFATLFYLVFFAMNIINNIKERRHFTAPEIMILLSNTFLYYSAGMYVLQFIAGGNYQGLFTMVIAIFNFIFAYLLYQNQKADRNLVYLLIGLVLTFLSLTAPVQLKGNYITLFWALESVLLLWLSQKSGIKLIKVASVVVLGLMFLSLLMDWNLYYNQLPSPLNIVLNRVSVTGFVAVAALAANLWLLRKEHGSILFELLDANTYRTLIRFALVFSLYFVLLFELIHTLDSLAVSYATKYFILGFYNYLYLFMLLLLSSRQPNQQVQQGMGALAVLGILLYLVLQHPLTIDTRNAYLLDGGETLGAFMLHYLPLVLVLLIVVQLLRMVALEFGFNALPGKVALWGACFVVVFLASAELEHLVVLQLYEPGTNLEALLPQVRKVGFPILWGISSFVLMTVGMRRKMKTLRIISLSLFFLTLLKLFLFDIRGVSEGGKIAAFICLGVLLLVISFMYQKLKVLILDDEATPPHVADNQ
ncbi:DUF2339 domain-containing protein [Pontibacter sp. BT731]|uniref:DUF2339 domain-containing protein n=1 Tax=Pontibacter coccineus TaxID=3063328 RepID=UPI0026E22EE7|nr:DUF2339 domain-containing protein [Pontibacter sp. BT731]MDO6392016.1 DUF2339 domain-containing protein [Pontibacter sp. BT731]